MTNKMDLQAEARRAVGREKAGLEARLRGGEWLDLGEAATLFDIRPGQHCHAAAGYRVMGRRGVLGALQELPTDALLFMTLRMRGADFVALTDDGETVYGLMIALPDGQSIGEAGEISAALEVPAAIASSEGAPNSEWANGLSLDQFFERLAEPKPDWSIGDYKAELERECGLTIAGKGGVGCASIRAGTIVLNPTGKASIITMLCGVFVRGFSINSLGKVRRQTCKRAISWLKESHPAIWHEFCRWDPEDDKHADKLVQSMRECEFFRYAVGSPECRDSNEG